MGFVFSKSMLKRRCIVCNKVIPFNIKFSHLYSRKKYCSEKCRRKENYRRHYKPQRIWKPQEIKCKVCGKSFIQKTPNQKYCSHKCMRKSVSFVWRIENSDNIDSYLTKLRFEIFKRDNFTCQYCGRNVKDDKIKIHADHIIPKIKGGKNIPKNLITSCEECNLGKGDVLLTERLLK